MSGTLHASNLSREGEDGSSKETGRKNSYYGVKNGFNTFLGNRSNFSICEITSEIGNEKKEKGEECM